MNSRSFMKSGENIKNISYNRHVSRHPPKYNVENDLRKECELFIQNLPSLGITDIMILYNIYAKFIDPKYEGKIICKQVFDKVYIQPIDYDLRKKNCFYYLIKQIPDNNIYFDLFETIMNMNIYVPKRQAEQLAGGNDFGFYNTVSWYPSKTDIEIINKTIKLLHNLNGNIFMKNKKDETVLGATIKTLTRRDDPLPYNKFHERYFSIITTITEKQIKNIICPIINKLGDTTNIDDLEKIATCLLVQPNITCKIIIEACCTVKLQKTIYKDAFISRYTELFISVLDILKRNNPQNTDLTILFKEINSSQNNQEYYFNIFFDNIQNVLNNKTSNYSFNLQSISLLLGECLNKNYLIEESKQFIENCFDGVFDSNLDNNILNIIRFITQANKMPNSDIEYKLSEISKGNQINGFVKFSIESLFTSLGKKINTNINSEKKVIKKQEIPQLPTLFCGYFEDKAQSIDDTLYDIEKYDKKYYKELSIHIVLSINKFDPKTQKDILNEILDQCKEIIGEEFLENISSINLNNYKQDYPKIGETIKLFL